MCLDNSETSYLGGLNPVGFVSRDIYRIEEQVAEFRKLVFFGAWSTNGRTYRYIQRVFIKI